MAATQLSPGVQIVEKDASLIVPGVSSTVGASVGVFKWGPTLKPILVSNETDLVEVFGKPSKATAKYFFTAANFLRYTSAMYVVRVDNNSLNSVGSYTTSIENFALRAQFVAQKIGNVELYDDIVVDRYDQNAVPAQNPAIFAGRYPGDLANGIIVQVADASTFATWTYKDEFVTAPGTSDFVFQKAVAAGVSTTNARLINDEMHIIVIDGAGKFTGTPGAILEKFAFVSKASDALTFEGKRNYYVDVIRNGSNYVYVLKHPHFATDWGTQSEGKTAPYANIQAGTSNGSIVSKFDKGTSLETVSDAQIQFGYDLFKDDQTFDISLLPVGEVSVNVIKYVVENIAEVRKDCVVFASAKGVEDNATTDVAAVMVTNTTVAAENKMRNWASLLNPSTYLVVDSGYKYQYDRYNDSYLWAALNADTAGLCARTDQTDDAWFSPAGFTRGQIKSVVRLAWNPNKAQRDVIYQRGINPVVSFPGQGTLLFGDKTFQVKPSAFDRINVRRLFIVLEKSIAISARFNLFDLNNELTRALFVGRTEPFLRDVQARNGIEDFRVICDETNNPAVVRARNEFRGTILIKPVYSINFITLTFTAVGPNVSFDTAAGV